LFATCFLNKRVKKNCIPFQRWILEVHAEFGALLEVHAEFGY